jgi:hypothetical protein
MPTPLRAIEKLSARKRLPIATIKRASKKLPQSPSVEKIM